MNSQRTDADRLPLFYQGCSCGFLGLHQSNRSKSVQRTEWTAKVQSPTERPPKAEPDQFGPFGPWTWTVDRTGPNLKQTKNPLRLEPLAQGRSQPNLNFC